MYKRFYSFIFLFLYFQLSSYAINYQNLNLDNSNYEYIKNKYGTNAKRVKLWNKMIESSKMKQL